MSFTPFHDLADQLDIIADQVRTLGDQVHTGNYTVPVVAEEDEAPPVEPPANGDTEEPPVDAPVSTIETTETLPAE